MRRHRLRRPDPLPTLACRPDAIGATGTAPMASDSEARLAPLGCPPGHCPIRTVVFGRTWPSRHRHQLRRHAPAAALQPRPQLRRRSRPERPKPAGNAAARPDPEVPRPHRRGRPGSAAKAAARPDPPVPRPHRRGHPGSAAKAAARPDPPVPRRHPAGAASRGDRRRQREDLLPGAGGGDSDCSSRTTCNQRSRCGGAGGSTIRLSCPITTIRALLTRMRHRTVIGCDPHAAAGVARPAPSGSRSARPLCRRPPTGT